MSDFKIFQALFYVVKTFKRRPLSVLSIAIWQTLIYIPIVFILAFEISFSVLTLANMDAIISGNMTEIPVSPSASDPFYMLVLMIGGNVLPILFLTAWARLMAADRMPALIPFRLGADEGRIFVYLIVLVALTFASCIPILILFTIVNIPLLVVSAQAGTDPNWALLIIINTVLVVIYIIALYYFIARFSPTPGLIMIDKKLELFGGWSASKPMVWPLFWCHLLLLIPLIIFYTLFSILFFSFPVFLQDMGAALSSEYSTTVELFSSWLNVMSQSIGSSVFTLMLLVYSGFMTLYFASWVGIGAYAARLHKGLDV